MSKIAVFTGTRAEYGLLYWLLKELESSPELSLQLYVGGTHLAENYGLTINHIIDDGFAVTECLDFLDCSDSDISTGISLASAVSLASSAFQIHKPDLLVILGDRYEALGIAQAAMMQKIPIAHIHGGEITEGAIDDVIRHAISKMSHLHFTSTEQYRKRVIQMGEQPSKVFNVGAPGIDNIKKLELMDLQALSSSLNFSLDNGFLLVTYHPVTLTSDNGLAAQENLLMALQSFPDLKVIITFPNADTNSQQLIESLKVFEAQSNGNVLLMQSMGQLRYLSAMKHARVVVGNSSSGIIEAPTFHVPTVNIGNRQKGRIGADSIIHCDETTQSIVDAIKQAIDLEVSCYANPYGDGNASKKIVKHIREQNIGELIQKEFYDITF